jgi:hypothetical protein
MINMKFNVCPKNIEKENIGALDYNTMQAWKRLQKHIIS